MQHDLPGHQFTSLEETENRPKTWIDEKDETFFQSKIQIF